MPDPVAIATRDRAGSLSGGGANLRVIVDSNRWWSDLAKKSLAAKRVVVLSNELRQIVAELPVRGVLQSDLESITCEL